MSILMIISFPLAFLIHDLEEILVQHKWMSAHKEDLFRRFPRLQPMILNLSSLSSKAFTIAVLEELVLLLLATAYYLADGPYALEIWTALFVAFSVHLVVHIGQGIIFRGYVPGLITSILLLPYSYYGINCICQKMDFSKLLLLGVIGFVAIAVNLWFAHWLGKKFFFMKKRTSSSGNSPATISLHNTSKSQKLLERGWPSGRSVRK